MLRTLLYSAGESINRRFPLSTLHYGGKFNYPRIVYTIYHFCCHLSSSPAPSSASRTVDVTFQTASQFLSLVISIYDKLMARVNFAQTYFSVIRETLRCLASNPCAAIFRPNDQLFYHTR